MRLDGRLPDDQLGGDLAVRLAGREQPEHFELSRGELVESGGGVDGGSRGGELLDQPACDAGGEEGVALPDGADRGDELARGHVLEEEPARAGTQAS